MASTTPPDQNDPSVYLHAELLPNIRHITLHISLPTTTTTTTSPGANTSDSSPLQISLSDSRRAVSIPLPAPHHDIAETMKLPARVSPASRRALSTSTNTSQGQPTPDGTRREYSFRMQVDPDEQTAAETDGFVPWTATDMSSSTRLRCLGCGSGVLTETGADRERTGWVWKDLPSGNWAEMMDFWHCHKPDPVREDSRDGNGEGHGHEEDPNAVVKGYGAANQVVATPGTVLVDVATFLVAGGDCAGLKQVRDFAVRSGNTDDSSEPDAIQCVNCDSLVGVEDTVAHGWRLFKTNLSASMEGHDPSQDSSWVSYPVETVVAAQLLEFIERESTRRFVVHSGRKYGLLIWVFNPDLRYSNSSSHHSIAAQRAMKVFFQFLVDVDETLHPEPGKASPLSLEELKLPPASYSAFAAALDQSNAMLPVSAREFREWKVGILHRFERSVGERT
ncbi:hypothetical protein BO71DRAFT_326879 [Aspergillus ellipticus CBS 707.79]|uniref:Ubiquitin-conjugating enzyme E2-binding protein n=1 Tax=Aspergillus ellipticus CBS 707.79 TaxID=1448320 RepID=A0A319D9G1_9EURO|nr:hypothetical protein BO71DRAFT_326879 [Aspergillus ellipticus CBS 707.79]